MQPVQSKFEPSHSSLLGKTAEKSPFISCRLLYQTLPILRIDSVPCRIQKHVLEVPSRSLPFSHLAGFVAILSPRPRRPLRVCDLDRVHWEDRFSLIGIPRLLDKAQ
jgi:hypothetical protein